MKLRCDTKGGDGNREGLGREGISVGAGVVVCGCVETEAEFLLTKCLGV